MAKMRFYTGNLSVGHFMEYWGTGKPGSGDIATPEYCAQMKSVSVSAVCDYLAWCKAESEPGKWDWSFYDRNEKVLHENGLQYNVFCWLHFPPKWFMETPDYVPYRCVEHDQPVQQTSLWAPGTLKIYDRFYKELAAHFGDRFDFLRLATPAEYGEVGYPNGMTNWLVPQDHKHAGFWCNDPYARADFRRQMEKRYRTIHALNKSWGTQFPSFEEIEFPAIAKDQSKCKDPLAMTPGERKWILDFIGWYYDSQIEFARKAVGIVRKYFPGKEIILSMGYGSQLTAHGNDDVAVARLCRELKVACQTPGNIPYFCMKSLSSPCHFYGVPYFTEPPGGMNPNQEIDRIWSDASCGTQTYFDYPGNLLGAKEVFRKYRGHLTGKKAIVDVAILFPTTEHRLRYEDWPARTMAGANALREMVDYDLVDERMISDGALKNYSMLIAYDGNIMQAATLKALKKWLEGGGILLISDFGPIETVDGDRSFIQSASQEGRQSVGKGSVIVTPEDGTDFGAFAADLAHNLSKRFPGKPDVPLIDHAVDGITATLFADRILYLNPTDQPIEKQIELRSSDFTSDSRTGRPSSFGRKLLLEPHSIAEIKLR